MGSLTSSYHVLLKEPRFSGICNDHEFKLVVLREEACVVKLSPSVRRVTQKAKKRIVDDVFAIVSEFIEQTDLLTISINL